MGVRQQGEESLGAEGWGGPGHPGLRRPQGLRRSAVTWRKRTRLHKGPVNTRARAEPITQLPYGAHSALPAARGSGAARVQGAGALRPGRSGSGAWSAALDLRAVRLFASRAPAASTLQSPVESSGRSRER